MCVVDGPSFSNIAFRWVQRVMITPTLTAPRTGDSESNPGRLSESPVNPRSGRSRRR